MSPFIAIHKMLRWSVWGVVLLGCVWLYQQRAFLDPALAFAKTLWYTDWSERKEARETFGEVTKVLDDDSFQLKEPSGKLYNIQLAGLAIEDPQYQYPREDATYYDLKEMLVSNRVQVVFTYVNEQGAGIGVAHLDGKNVNAALIESGKAVLQSDQLSRLPVSEQFELRLASRRGARMRASSAP